MNARLRRLAEAAIRAPSADNSQPWSLDWDGATLAVQHRDSASDTFGRGAHASMLSAGHVVEAACEFLHAARARFDVGAPAQPRLGAPYAAIAIASLGEAEPRDLPGTARHTNRFPYATRALPLAALRDIGAQREGAARIVVVDDARRRHGIAEVVKACSRARFRTRELHEGLMRSLRWTEAEAAAGDGLDVATLHLPPGARAFMRATSDWRTQERLNRLGLYRLLATADSALLFRAPALAAVVGHEDAEGVLAAGRLSQRVWTALNALGLAVHPYYAATDQRVRLNEGAVPLELRGEVAGALGELPRLLDLADGDVLHLMFRIGWPTREPRRSRRLPVDRLFADRGGARAPA
jgi:hypothetical protein